MVYSNPKTPLKYTHRLNANVMKRSAITNDAHSSAVQRATMRVIGHVHFNSRESLIVE